jgi:hypothetical protein
MEKDDMKLTPNQGMDIYTGLLYMRYNEIHADWDLHEPIFEIRDRIAAGESPESIFNDIHGGFETPNDVSSLTEA